MKRIFTIIIFLSAIASVQAQDNFGLGVRVGDPTGITVKKYFGGKSAAELNIGTSPYYNRGYYHGYYNRAWHRKYNYYYDNYYRGSNFDVQLHYMIQKDIRANIQGKLQWYLGGGLQVRTTKYYADYWDNNGNWHRRERFNDLDLGLDVLVGVEYTFEDLPITVFIDTNLFLEVVDYPYPWWQFGLGGRWNF